MPEQLLDGPQVGAVAQQVGGIGVPQAMRMDGGIARDHPRVKLHDAARAAIRQPAAAMVQEQGLLVAASGLP